MSWSQPYSSAPQEEQGVIILLLLHQLMKASRQANSSSGMDTQKQNRSWLIKQEHITRLYAVDHIMLTYVGVHLYQNLNNTESLFDTVQGL